MSRRERSEAVTLHTKDTNGRLEATDNFARVKRQYSLLGKLPRYYGFWTHVTFMGRERSMRRNAVERLNLKKGDRVLEIACGTGRDFPYLIDAIGNGGSLVGCDYTQEMLDSAGDLCRRKGWENVELVQGDAAKLDFTGKDFDGVLAVLCFSVMHDWAGILQRCQDVLRPGFIEIIAGVFCEPIQGEPAARPIFGGNAQGTAQAFWLGHVCQADTPMFCQHIGPAEHTLNGSQNRVQFTNWHSAFVLFPIEADFQRVNSPAHTTLPCLHK